MKNLSNTTLEMVEYELKYYVERVAISIFAPTEMECWIKLQELLSPDAAAQTARIDIYVWDDEVNNRLDGTLFCDAFGNLGGE